MKFKILLCFAVLSFVACQGSHSKRSITENGETLTIKVDIKNKIQSIDYDQSFDVRNMTASERKELVKHIYDSLDIAE